MKASEAQQLSISSCKKETEKILKLIEQNSKLGYTSLHTSNVKSGTILSLKKLGYNIESIINIEDNSIVAITWN